MRSIRKTFTLLLTCMLLASLLIPHIAVGQTPSTGEASPSAENESAPRFVIRPHDGQDGAFFTVNAEAGSTTELTAVLGNAGTEPVDLYTFSSNAVVLVNGGFGIEEEDADPTGPTTWVDWPSDSFTFEPGEGIERTFTVTVPEDAEPGEYITGIALETAEPIDVAGSSMFNQVIRKAVAVFIVVEGDTSASFELGDPEIVTTGGGSRIEVPVSNTGDVLVRPSGTMTLTKTNGDEVFNADISMGSVYARMDTRLSVPLDESLAGNEYEVSLTVADENTQTQASIEPQVLEFTGEVAASAPVQIVDSSISPMPDADDPVYADVNITIANSADEITDGTVILHVLHDGEAVEDFALGSNMTIAPGETSVEQRYIPTEGFEEGEWTFEVSVQSATDPSTITTQVINEPLPDTISIP